MGFNFIPAAHGQLRSQNTAEVSVPPAECFQSDWDDPLYDPRWPAGWWILPFSICGAIETAGIAWFFGLF